MSKRRNRASQPNLPKETLERARQQAGLPPATPPADEASAAPATPASTTEPVAAQPVATQPVATEKKSAPEPKSTARSATTPSRVSTARRRPRTGSSQGTARKRDIADPELIAEMLMNPTKTVSAEEMRAAYGYVLVDLRNMGVLAGALVVLLVILAQVL